MLLEENQLKPVDFAAVAPPEEVELTAGFSAGLGMGSNGVLFGKGLAAAGGVKSGAEPLLRSKSDWYALMGELTPTDALGALAIPPNKPPPLTLALLPPLVPYEGTVGA